MSCVFCDPHKRVGIRKRVKAVCARHRHLIHACEMCDFATMASKHMAQHVRDKHTPQGCKRCWRCFRIVGAGLHNHLKMHACANACAICDKHVHSADQLQQHAVLHQFSRTFACARCGQVEHHRRKLGTHMWKRHQHQFHCLYCKFTSPCHNITRIKNHMHARHADLDIQQCPICSMLFSKEDYAVHVRYGSPAGGDLVPCHLSARV